MSLSNRMRRPLDHLVLPVINLMTARLRLSALGFSVAPEARHPFGTENACVYFTDSTYLEPLGIADRATYDAHVKSGSEFIRRDDAFRFRVGEDGLSAIVFKSEDASADHAEFSAAGIVAGDLFSFSRPFEREDGSAGTAGFRLAFAADLRSPDIFFFTCERLQALSPPDVLLAHANGVTGIAGVLVGEDSPMEFESILQTLSNCHDIDIHPDGVTIDAVTADISVFTYASVEKRFGLRRRNAGRGLEPLAVIFEAVELGNVADILAQNEIVYERTERYILVPPAPGQGITFIFREE